MAKMHCVCVCVNNRKQIIDSLVPRPPPFVPSVCVHNKWKIGKKLKWERLGNIHHVSGRKVEVEGEGTIFKY